MNTSAVLEAPEHLKQPDVPLPYLPLAMQEPIKQPEPPLRIPAGAFEELSWNRFIMGMPPDNLISDLEEVYVIEDRPSVAAFIEKNRLRVFLSQAVRPLNRVFGEATVRTLTLVSDDEGFQTLYCLVMLPSTLADARQALGAFDREWWLNHCGQVDGRLNFDFELV